MSDAETRKAPQYYEVPPMIRAASRDVSSMLTKGHPGPHLLYARDRETLMVIDLGAVSKEHMPDAIDGYCWGHGVEELVFVLAAGGDIFLHWEGRFRLNPRVESCYRNVVRRCWAATREKAADQQWNEMSFVTTARNSYLLRLRERLERN